MFIVESMSTVDDTKKKAADTYNAASDFFDHLERVGLENRDFIHRRSLRSVECNVVYASAVKS